MNTDHMRFPSLNGSRNAERDLPKSGIMAWRGGLLVVCSLFAPACLSGSGGGGWSDAGLDGAPSESGAGGFAGGASGGTGAAGSNGSGATGSSGTAGAGGAEAFSCDPLCQFYASCNAKTTCEIHCQVVLNDLPQCETALQAYTSCIGDTVATCYATSTPVPPDDCAQMAAAWNECGACVPQPTSDECLACSQTECCLERKDYYGHPQWGHWLGCAGACAGNAACEAQCWQTYPALDAAHQALVTCAAAKCDQECYCQPEAGDSSCLGCVKQACCTEFATYSAAPGAEQFDSCLDPCTDSACVDGCAAAFPQAGAAYAELLVCVGGQCTGAC